MLSFRLRKQISENVMDAIFNFHWICSIMKIFIICWVPAQILYLGKIWFLRYKPKCPQPIRLQDFQINFFSRTNQWNSFIFFHVDTNSQKLKVVKNVLVGLVQKWMWLIWSLDSKIDWFFACWYKFIQMIRWLKIFEWAWSKMGVASLVKVL